MSLTYKQEQFCKNVVAGMTAQDSYLKAYNSNSKSAASIEAMKLLKRDDITAYISELQKPINNLYQNTIISERQKQIKEIQERIEICKKKEDEQSLIRYYDMLNKIYGVYKEDTTEQKTENNINNLDNDTLKKIAAIS